MCRIECAASHRICGTDAAPRQPVGDRLPKAAGNVPDAVGEPLSHLSTFTTELVSARAGSQNAHASKRWRGRL